jgi:GNAT superfamily N-acetyltransferase
MLYFLNACIVILPNSVQAVRVGGSEEMEMVIRAAQEADAPAMGQLMVETWLAAHKGQIPKGQWQARERNWTPEVSARGWAETLRDMAAGESPDYCIYLAELPADPPQLIGIVMGGPAKVGPWLEAGEIYALYVRQEWQGQGVGKALLATAVRRLAQLGMTQLVIGCLDTNAPACGFYEACGGQKVGEVETEDEGFPERQRIYGWEDSAVIYQKDK